MLVTWAANKVLGRTGETFWQNEYDHWVRNQPEFSGICRYIEDNPVSGPEAYRWSSSYGVQPRKTSQHFLTY